jgi:hypothetical protein
MANKINVMNLGLQIGFYDEMPSEIILLIAEHLNPADLYTFMLTSKRIQNLIISRIPQFVKLYVNVLQLDVEKFMWKLFNDDYFEIKDKDKLFIRMLEVHNFAHSDILEYIYDNYEIEPGDFYLPLPEEEKQLYIKKFQAGMICGLNNRKDYFLISLFTYAFTDDIFEFLFKFINKYIKLALFISKHSVVEQISIDVEYMIGMEMTFEMLDHYLTNGLTYGAKLYETYNIIMEGGINGINNFFRLLSYGVEVYYAKDDFEDENFYDYELENYNAIRHIIGSEFAYQYILQKKININNIPNFLENVVRLRSIDVDDIKIVDIFLQNPTNECFENIQMQMDIFGRVDIYLL